LTGRTLRIRPGPPLAGDFRPPGDKSVTHRALLLALLAGGRSVVLRPNPGLDCAATARCIQALGATVRPHDEGLEIEGRGFDLVEPDTVLDCGNSGTTLRLLSGVLAARPFLAVLAGDASLNRRPVARVIEPLRAMGATLSARDRDRLPPLVIQGAALTGIDYRLPVASAQVASAILLAGLQARGTTTVTLPGPARDHTQRLLRAFGVPVTCAEDGRRIAVSGGGAIPPFRCEVPGDLSAAAFFLAAAALAPGAQVTARGVSLNPTRTAFLDVLEVMGATVRRSAARLESGEDVGEVTVVGPPRLTGVAIPADWLPRMIDEVPAWAMLAAVAEGRSTLAGAGELRIKESDRLAVLARNLGALGASVQERPEGLEIVGGRLAGGRVDAAGDHRIAMAFAILGARLPGGLTIAGAEGIATSYPGFLADLRALGGVAEPVEAAS
jgi:3-phosphoshikimate 1-carboxyvinyltransferase